jgi:hypothetical protein
MSRATPQLRRFAERLIAFDARGEKPAGVRALLGLPAALSGTKPTRQSTHAAAPAGAKRKELA